MRLLLDSHAGYWWMTGNPKLSAPARELILDSANTVLVSAASIYEIESKARRRRVDRPPQELRAALRRHALDWKPGPPDWQDARAWPPDPDKLVRHPTYFDRTWLLQEVRRELGAPAPADPLLTEWTSKEHNAVAHDYLRCRGTPAKTGRFLGSLRSLTSRVCLRHAVDGCELRVHIGPAKRKRNALRAALVIQSDLFAQLDVHGHRRIVDVNPGRCSPAAGPDRALSRQRSPTALLPHDRPYFLRPGTPHG